MSFKQKLSSIVKKNNSLLCVGLDPDIAKISESQFEFNKKIIDTTHDLVCCYKPNIAFYEAEGPRGLEVLKKTMDYLRNNYSEIPIIVDAKRADIANTNDGYVKYIFDYMDADAITLHPYMGGESLKPFFNKAEKEIFILCRTSNPGAGEFQDLEVNGKKLFEIVAEKVSSEWNRNSNCGLVVGATYPEELQKIRKIVGDMPILIPGIGAQGGNIEKTVKAGVDKNGENAIINASRSIIFAQNPRGEGEKLRDEINKYR